MMFTRAVQRVGSTVGRWGHGPASWAAAMSRGRWIQQLQLQQRQHRHSYSTSVACRPWITCIRQRYTTLSGRPTSSTSSTTTPTTNPHHSHRRHLSYNNPPTRLDASTLKAKATAFIKSYHEAMRLSWDEQTGSSLDSARACASHYLVPGFILFNNGFLLVHSSREECEERVRGHIDGIAKHGIGGDVRLEGYRVEVVSGNNALCWVKFSHHPPEGRGLESWEFENVYSFRVLETGEGVWDFVIKDNEFDELVKRVPEFRSYD